jgi:hypothetical protein
MLVHYYYGAFRVKEYDPLAKRIFYAYLHEMLHLAEKIGNKFEHGELLKKAGIL